MGDLGRCAVALCDAAGVRIVLGHVLCDVHATEAETSLGVGRGAEFVPGRIVHIAGLVMNVGSLRRQRCAWCGIPIEDIDLAQVAVQLPADGSDPAPLPTWPVGALIAMNGAVRHTVEAEMMTDGGHEVVKLPDDCCAKLPAELTR